MDLERDTHDTPKPDDEAGGSDRGADAIGRLKRTLGIDGDVERDKEHDDEMARPPEDRSPLT